MMRLLLIEDNLPDIELFKITLRHLKISDQVELTEVLDGEAALELLTLMSDAELPDVILLDLKLPKLDGKQILVELKANTRFRRIPVIIFSSSDAYEDIRDSYSLGASCYVKKASDFNQMQTTIRRLAEFWLQAVSLPRPTWAVN